ncbi:hypothetical protein TNCV_1609311 [Trichonephila clavipes]|nr:hypothetical protein TNCV_1609311 [Trichonephila clavipes]
MEIPLRTAYGQNGRCGMQPKAKHSLRAQAQLMRTETVETFELVKVKPKLFREKKKNARVKNALKGTHFQSVEEVKAKSADLLKTVTPNEPQHYFERWKTLMELCIDREGEHVEGYLYILIISKANPVI